MPHNGDGMVIGDTKASAMSRGGHCVRQDGVVIGVATTPSTTRLLWRCDGIVKWLQVVCIEDWKIKIRG
jgi:hypothetical protein